MPTLMPVDCDILAILPSHGESATLTGCFRSSLHDFKPAAWTRLQGLAVTRANLKVLRYVHRHERSRYTWMDTRSRQEVVDHRELEECDA